MDLKTQIPWLRGVIDYSSLSSITDGRNQVYLVARDSSTQSYYHLYYDVSQDLLAWASIEYQSGQSNRPVLLSIQKSENAWVLYAIGDRSGYLYNSTNIQLAKSSSIKAAQKFSIENYRVYALEKTRLYAGAWCSIIGANGESLNWSLYTNNQSGFSNVLGVPVLATNLEYCFLPVNGIFWSNARYLSGGITQPGCYNTRAYDTLITLQDVLKGNYTEDSPPTSRLPITGCTTNVSHWLNNQDNFCVYTQLADCQRQYWYAYCEGSNTCGTCMSSCLTGVCSPEYAVDSSSSKSLKPLSCSPTQSTPPKAGSLTFKQKLVVGGVVGVLLLMLGIFVYAFLHRRSRRPKVSLLETLI